MSCLLIPIADLVLHISIPPNLVQHFAKPCEVVDNIVAQIYESSAKSNFRTGIPPRCPLVMPWPLSSCPHTTIRKCSRLLIPMVDLVLHISAPPHLGQHCAKKPCVVVGIHVTMAPEPSAGPNFRSGNKVSSSSKCGRPFARHRPLSWCTYTTVHKCSWLIICSVATLILFLNQTKSCRHAKQT